MYKKKKRVVALVLGFIFSFGVITPVLAQEGVDEEKNSIEKFSESKEEIIPLAIGQKAECFILENKGSVSVRAYFKGDSSVKKVTIKLLLQKYTKGKWAVVKSWKEGTTKKIFTITKSKSVAAGKYRAKTKAKFTTRWASATYLAVATHTRPQVGVTYKPRHETSSGKVLKNFSPWKTKSFIIPSDQRLFFGKSNGTDVTYSKTTKNRERFSCYVFVSDAPVPRRTFTINMSLKY